MEVNKVLARRIFSNLILAPMFSIIPMINGTRALASEITLADCSVEKMDELRGAAQSRSPKTGDLAKALLVCPTFKDEALVWAAIYESSMERYESVSELTEQVEQPSATASRLTILSRAAKGAYQTLEDLVKSDQAGWEKDAESYFVLARAYVRDRKLKKAKWAYQRYLELKPDDYDMRLEAAFALMGEFPRLSKKWLDEVEARSDSSEAQKESVKRGRQWLAVSFAPRYYSSSVTDRAEIPLTYENFSDSVKHFQRRSLKTGYYRPEFEIDLSQIQLTSDDQSTIQDGTEMSVKKVFQSENQQTQLLTSLGWFQGEESGVGLGRVAASHSSSSGLTSSLSYEVEPWVKQVALAKDFTNWTRQTGTLQFKYFDFISFRHSRARVADEAQLKQNIFDLKLPLWRPSLGRQKLSGFASAELLQADRYSPFVYSPKEAKTGLVGLLHQLHWGSSSSLQLRAAYGTYESQLNAGDGGATATYSIGTAGKVAQASAEFFHRFNQQWAARGLYQASNVVSKDGEGVYHSQTFLVGIVWNDNPVLATGVNSNGQ